MELVDLLKKWNADLLKDEAIDEVVDPAYLKAKWLGLPPASDADIVEAEARLGTTLPPSYRAFLLIANGWVYPGNDMDFPGPLRPIEQVGWFRDEDAQRIQAWSGEEREHVSDDEYLIYGEDQDPATVRVEYLSGCLKIGEVSDGGVYLLNPAVTTESGEWEAWHFSDELPGATRCRSFGELIRQQRALFRQYLA